MQDLDKHNTAASAHLFVDKKFNAARRTYVADSTKLASEFKRVRSTVSHFMNPYRQSGMGERAEVMSAGDKVHRSLTVFSSNFVDFCQGDMEAYYFYEVLLSKGLLESAANDLPAAAQFSSNSTVGTCSTMSARPRGGRLSSGAIDVDAVVQRIAGDFNPETEMQRRERTQRAATAEYVADQELFKSWQGYKREKAALQEQGDEVPEWLKDTIVEAELEMRSRSAAKKAARAAAAAPAPAAPADGP